MSEAKPLSTCSVFKDDVVSTGHEGTSIEHVIKKEEVDLEPDYIEIKTEEGIEMTYKDEQTDNCDFTEDNPYTYNNAAEFEDNKKTIPLFDNHNVEGSRLDVNVHTNVETRNSITSEQDNGNSQVYKYIQINEVKIEYEPNDETSENEITNDLNDIHESDTDTKTCVADDVYHTDTTNIKFENGTIVYKHVKEELHICDIDNEACTSACSLRPHLIEKPKSNTRNKLKQGTNRYSCNQCTYTCVKETTLVRHMAVHGEIGEHSRTPVEKVFSCKICDYKSKRKSHLLEHMCTHTGTRPFSCEICDYKSNRKDTLEQHMIIHADEKPFSCHICEYKTKRRFTLQQHMRTHTDEKPFSCNECELKFKLKKTLVYHMRTHTGERPYSCNICSYKCPSKHNLNNHMRTHTTEKLFPCDICEYKFTRKETLQKHIRTHTGEKPFPCKICSYKGAQKHNLISHMKTHTNEKPFSCHICEFRTKRKYDLKKHISFHKQGVK